MRTAPPVYLGTSGFTAAGWAGSFYPAVLKAADYLSFYADHFETVEVDSTFYGCPSQSDRRRSEEHTSELQSPDHLVCRLLLEKKKHGLASLSNSCVFSAERRMHNPATVPSSTTSASRSHPCVTSSKVEQKSRNYLNCFLSVR